MAPCLAAPALPLVIVALFGWRAVPWLLCGGLGFEYLAQYFLELVGGRTIDPPSGTVDLVGDTMWIASGGDVTSVAVADIIRARWFTSEPWDDLRGLCDVLELELPRGSRLRIPACFTGFGQAVAGLRGLRQVEDIEVG